MHSMTALATVMLVVACNSHQPPGGGPATPPNGSSTMTTQTPQPPPKTTLEQVQRWAKPGMSVGSLDTRSIGPDGVDVPGVELFMVSDPNQRPPADGNRSYTLVAIAGGVGQPILQDGPAIARAVAAATKDALTLARVGLLIGRRRGEILTAASTDQQRKANVKPPAVAGTSVEFWVLTSGVGRNLLHARFDLASAQLELGAPPPAAGDIVANAITTLADANAGMHAEALRTLAQHCSDAAAKKALFDALASHAREETRAAAAEAAPACGASAVDALIHALETDKARLVRGKAALALGEIGDRRAKPALEKATSTDIASAAKIALGKLK
jgi:hypothetical protein